MTKYGWDAADDWPKLSKILDADILIIRNIIWLGEKIIGSTN
jgi:hypothetical protein